MMVNTWQSKKQFCHCLVTLSCSLHCPLIDDWDQEDGVGVHGLLDQEDDLRVGENLNWNDQPALGKGWF